MIRSLVSDERTIASGPFRLLPAQRLLQEGKKPVRLGSCALDLLIVLVEHPGEVVGKDELMACAWARTFVEGGQPQVPDERWVAVIGTWSMSRGASTVSSPRSPPADPWLVPSTLASVLGPLQLPPSRLGAFLGDRQVLLVLDNYAITHT